MFTGIVEHVGTVERTSRSDGGIRFSITAGPLAKELKIDNSIAINGVCLTVVSRRGSIIDVVAVEETLKKTTLHDWKRGTKVNLELPLRFNQRLGGHLVLGHVDTVGSLYRISDLATSTLVSMRIPSEFLDLVVPVGSIAVDGVSLTIAQLEEDIVTVSIIPYTMEHTIFSTYRAGARMNLEFDIIGKYVKRMTHHSAESGSLVEITEERLKEMGF